METPHHLLNLPLPDRTLIETAITRRFDLSALVDAASPHPAQHSLTSLVAWLDQPHIHTATETCIRIFTRAAAYAASLDAPAQAAALKRLLASTLDLLDRSPIPADPAAADKAITRNHRIGREARLLTAAIAKSARQLSDQANPRQPKPSTSRRSSRHHTNPAAHLASTNHIRAAQSDATDSDTNPDTGSPAHSFDDEPVNRTALFSELALLNAELSQLALTLKAANGTHETPDSEPSDSPT